MEDPMKKIFFDKKDSCFLFNDPYSVIICYRDKQFHFNSVKELKKITKMYQAVVDELDT